MAQNDVIDMHRLGLAAEPDEARWNDDAHTDCARVMLSCLPSPNNLFVAPAFWQSAGRCAAGKIAVEGIGKIAVQVCA